MSVQEKKAPATRRPRRRRPRKPRQSQPSKISPSPTVASSYVKAPVARARMVRNTAPRFETLRNGDCIIAHREYIGDISAGTGTPSLFNVNTFVINPGQQNTFQWLSRLAANYESYKFERLAFCYETEAPTTLGGTLLLAVDYDASDPAPGSKQQAMAYRSSVRSPPWNPVKFSATREDLAKFKTNYVRTGTQPSGTDIRTFDIGNLFVISQGVGTSGATLGELYVEYAVRLMTPVSEPNPFVLGGNIQQSFQSATQPFTVDATGTFVGFQIVDSKTESILYFQYAANFLVVSNHDGASTPVPLVATSSSSNIVVAAGSDATDTNDCISYLTIQVVRPGNVTFTMPGGAGGTVNIYISQTPV